MADLFSKTPTVSEITSEIKNLLEDNFAHIRVEGEVSQPKMSRNGHVYFTLKDAGAQLPCVIWGSNIRRHGIRLEHGQQVICEGDIQLYAPHGKYQMIVSTVEQAGLGALQQAYEKLKIKLKNEGLFEQSRKKPLPAYPKTLGVITSATGAAFQDIRDTLQSRYPLVKVYLYHASVQGAVAASELVNGLKFFQEDMKVDLIIIGRGGGSLEDLWPFNEESVARAIFASETPVISAVGHETDFCISDFVADARAATPTQAAVIAVPDINELRMFVEEADRRIHYFVTERLKKNREKVDYYLKNYALQRVIQRVQSSKDVISRKQEQLNYRFKNLLQSKQKSLVSLVNSLEKRDPNEPLKRGYTRIWQAEKWVKKLSDYNPDTSVQIEWQDGRSQTN